MSRTKSALHPLLSAADCGPLCFLSPFRNSGNLAAEMEAAFRRRAYLNCGGRPGCRPPARPTDRPTTELVGVGGNARALQEFCTINFNEGDSHIRLLYDRPKIRSGSYATRASKLASSRCPPPAPRLSLSLSLSNRARSGGSYLEVLRHDHPRLILPLSRTLIPIDRSRRGWVGGFLALSLRRCKTVTFVPA